ncbi:BMC domain-containing protein [Salinibacterium sp. TMP30]|uniref:BMC domain-containing protein n=1 Tax=Salinibacterium sp. TMP30 TaxID=3138237 RepID=UPI003138EDF5
MPNDASTALGIVATRGLVAAAEAADAMQKAAVVNYEGRHFLGDGTVTVLISGELAAVKAATDAAVDRARSVGEVLGVTVISRPSDAVHSLLAPQA